MSTGLRAENLREFVEILRAAPHDVIRHHLHRAPLRHHLGAWDYPNDFAQWVSDCLGDHALAEKLAALDPYAHRDLETARERIVELLEKHMDGLPGLSFVRRGTEFHFSSSHYLALPGEREVWTLAELRDALTEVSLGSLFFHFHEARLRDPGDDSDDFSRWIHGQFGGHPVLGELSGLDFYLFSLEDLRRRIVTIFDRHRDDR